jgi:PKD repeat protein
MRLIASTRGAFVAVALACALLGARFPALGPAAQAVGGLQNAGFEAGILNGPPQSWLVTQPVPDAAIVVGAEGPSAFGTYADMGGITVSPYRGNLMLRLGTPKRSAESQARGTNIVSQTFTASDATLRFSFRLFSWETRDRDIFEFDLKQGTTSVGTLAAPLVIDMPGGAPRSCSALPCRITMDVGSRGEFLDSGWRVITINQVPTGVPLTLRYAVGGTNDNAHATWAYFDDASRPPVASFSFSPAAPKEGAFIQFTDRSYDPDSTDAIVGWHWDIAGEQIDERNPFTILPDEGTYPVSLTVTSSDGSLTTVRSGESAADGTPIPPLVITNNAPVAQALNAEVLPGHEAPLVARFADTGWLDTHTATWAVAGATPTPALVEDNLAVLSTGLISGAATPAADVPGALTVRDADGGVATSGFNITVVADDPERYEPNGALDSAPPLRAGGSYLSYIQAAGDVDLFEVRMPDGSPLPAGAEVLATLGELPADFDVVLLARTPAGPPPTRFAQSSVGTVAFDDTRFAQSRFAQSRFAQSRFAQSRFAQSRFAQSGFSLTQVPLSAMGYTGISDGEISGRDIALDELGLGGLPSDVRVVSFSANLGLEDEHALGRIDAPGTQLFIAIVGANGARSLTPYRLQVEASAPVDLTAALGPEVCTGTPLVPSGASTSATQVLFANSAAPRTLIVTQRERMRALYALDDTAWNAVLADLTTLAQHAFVDGAVLSLPSDIYDDWDSSPCSIDTVNGLSAAIREALRPYLSGVEYVVFVGDDDIVPYRRVPDETVVSNERDYVIDALLRPGSPLLASILQGFNLSDDYYVDDAPSAWQGRELYIPDRAISRLVETPGEIHGQIAAFLQSGGVLNPQSGFVSGYDFFADGSQQTAVALGTKLPTSTLISDTWTADDLRCRFLGLPLPNMTGCAPNDLSAVNAHFTHYAGLSANGFRTGNFADVLTSEDVATAGGGTALLRRIAFSMGCHAGLNVPDRGALEADPGIGVDSALDFPQAMARQRAVYIASTGFGLGDDEGIGGTERLMLLYAQQLVSGQVDAGAALVAAKQAYLQSLAPMTVYDEKSSIQTVFYGLPMYRVVTAASPPPVAAVAAHAEAPAGALAPVPSTSVHVIDGATATTTAALSQVDSASGSYITADGDSQSTAGRPREPRMALHLPDTATPLVHGVLLRAGQYVDSPDGWDPVIARPTTDWEVGVAEPQTCREAFWPSLLASLNSLDTAGGTRQTLVVIPGQFRCTSGNGQPVRGVQRTYSDLTLELLRCPDADTASPLVSKTDLEAIGGGSVRVTVTASDPSGVARVVVLRFNAGSLTSTELAVDPPASGTFEVTVPNTQPGDDFIVQVQDGACNLTTITAKGPHLTTIDVDAGGDQQRAPAGTPNTFTARVANFASLGAGVTFDWDFGDGTFASGPLVPDAIDGNGTASFAVQHQYRDSTPSPAHAELRVTAAGGIGIDALEVIGTGNDRDGDGILDPDDNCIAVFNPAQANMNGEVIPLPKPFPLFDDHTNPAADDEGDACDSDIDGDGLTNDQELAAGTSPFIFDSDGDRTNDGTEVRCGSNPILAVSNLAGPDTDGDGLPDACEALYGSNPALPDTDGDGVRDGVEVRYWLSNPLSRDTDGDGCNDAVEIASVTADRAVTAADLGLIAGRFGALPPEYRALDSNGDGLITAADLGFTAAQFGPCVP